MPRHEHDLSRRTFLQASAAGIAAASAPTDASQQRTDHPRSEPPPRPDRPRRRLAVVTTAYHYLSHAYHICGRFLYGYLRHGQMHYPDWGIVSMHVEQGDRANDLSRDLAREHGFTLYPDIRRTLARGTDRLAVDGVLLIGEHGDYPYNDRGQKLYPRFRMYQQIVGTFIHTGQTVPVFCDKHLSYDRRHGFAMVNKARRMGFGLFAGSSLPVTWRRPELELPPGVRIREALVAARGELEIYGIHALEALQCMVERRANDGLQGVRAVRCLQGDAVWRAGDAGEWSWELLDHALGRTPSLNVGNVRENCRHFNSPPGRPTFLRGPIAFFIEYLDGLRATVLILNGHIDDTVFAARIEGERRPISTLFYLPPPPGAAFLQALSMKLEDFLATGRPPYPVERTLLTGGTLDWLLESRVRDQQRLLTPDLDIRYQAPRDSGFMRGDYTNPA
jgi:hypothetical protein